MKTLMFALTVLFGSSLFADDVYIRGYARGSHQSSYRMAPDGFLYNNLNTHSNINPYAGAMGTRVTPTPTYRPRPSYFTPGYQAPQRGGTTIRYGRW